MHRQRSLFLCHLLFALSGYQRACHSRCSLAIPCFAAAVEMTTGATIHTTNGLWLDIKPRQMPADSAAPPPPPAAEVPELATGGAASTGLSEERELTLAFANAAAQQQQQQQQPQA
jgi:hypothetical protein